MPKKIAEDYQKDVLILKKKIKVYQEVLQEVEEQEALLEVEDQDSTQEDQDQEECKKVLVGQDGYVQVQNQIHFIVEPHQRYL